MLKNVGLYSYPRTEHPAPAFADRESSESEKRVAQYFATSGFSRWAAIYGAGEVPPVWRVIREGHERALDYAIDWIQDDASTTALDAGCGTGSLAFRLADCGFEVHGFDVSAPMVSLASYLAQDKRFGVAPKFFVGDIAAIDSSSPRYDLVCCMDVLFHYPLNEMRIMLENLASLCARKIIGSYAVRTPLNAVWMQVGKRSFHRRNRLTNLHMYSYDQVEQILYRAGFRMNRRQRVKKLFYDSTVFEAVRR